MDLKLENSDVWLSDWGECEYLDGIDEVLQRVLICAAVPKGSFVYNKELGTELRKIDTTDSRSAKTATVLLNEALVGVEGASAEVKSLHRDADGSVRLVVSVSYMGETKETEVTLGADL